MDGGVGASLESDVICILPALSYSRLCTFSKAIFRRRLGSEDIVSCRSRGTLREIRIAAVVRAIGVRQCDRRAAPEGTEHAPGFTDGYL